MKKIVALTLLVMFLLSSVCMAYTPNPDRWLHIYSYPDGEAYFEKQIYPSDDSTRNLWILWIDKVENIRVLQQMSIKKNRTYTLLEMLLYDNKTNKFISSKRYSNPYEAIPPETIVDIAYVFTFPSE